MAYVGIFLQKQHGLLARPLSRVQISTMSVKEDLLVAGGFQGELICKVGSCYIKCFFATAESVIYLFDISGFFFLFFFHLFGAAH